MTPSERSYSQTMARLSGWANDPGGGKRRGWTGVAERAGLVLDCRDRGGYAEWQVSTRDGDTIGFLHEFPDHVYAFTFTGWEVRGRLRRLWHRIRGYRDVTSTQDRQRGHTMKPLHPAVEAILRFFEFAHLPEHLQEISQPFYGLAWDMALRLEGAELTAGLRKLLEAKDCMVRAAL